MARLRSIVLLGVLAGLMLTGSAAAQDTPFGEPDDLVSALVVKARTPGPAWWKVSDADTTVWILGSPGLLPESVKWDDSTLKRRLTGANRLILPPRESISVAGQMAMVARLGTGALRDRPVADRLPPTLFKRFKDDLNREATLAMVSNGNPYGVTGEGKIVVETRVDNTGVDVQAFKAPVTSLPPDLYGDKHPPKTIILALAALKLADTPLGKLVDEPAGRAEALATSLKTPRVRPGSVDSVAALKIRAAMPEATQQACLVGALDVLDAKDRRVAAQQAAALAWAQGDVPAALGRKDRFDMLGACAAPPAARAITDRNISAQVSAIRSELRRKGAAVAVIDLGELLQVGGVLDQLRAVKGVTITAPDRIDD
ncbi:MAG: TraB/GumN family protein [Caulobacteraceae bacterium]|nr:TraB/GumN family protein [Caulobacteraceae bacterium]